MNQDVKPVLILAWKRARAVKQLMNVLKHCEPSRLYFACDGPRLGVAGEEQLVKECITAFKSEISWDCEVEYLLNDRNKGCKDAVNAAISWFFSKEDSGIILEEDCIPNHSFLLFASEMLDRYSEVDRVWGISGFNPVAEMYPCETSYFYSKYFLCWGWATWRRCWLKHDVEMTAWGAIKNSPAYFKMFDSKRERLFWSSVWEQIKTIGKPSTWDYQYVFTSMINHGLFIIPAVNMIMNIGFSDDATHTTEQHFEMPKQLPMPESRTVPQLSERDIIADKLIFNRFLFPRRSLLRRITDRLARLPSSTLVKLCAKS